MIKRTSERKKIIAKLDNLVSKIVRERDGWTCQRCHKQYTPPTSSLHCSHYFPRQRLGTRWNLDNLDAVCMPCHFYHWESEKQSDYRAFKLKQLGEKGLELLEYKATAIAKYTTVELGILYEELNNENK